MKEFSKFIFLKNLSVSRLQKLNLTLRIGIAWASAIALVGIVEPLWPKCYQKVI